MQCSSGLIAFCVGQLWLFLLYFTVKCVFWETVGRLSVTCRPTVSWRELFFTITNNWVFRVLDHQIVRITDKHAPKAVAWHFNLPYHAKQHMEVCLSIHSIQVMLKSCKLLWNQWMFYINSSNQVMFFHELVSTSSIASSSRYYKELSTDNPLIHCDERHTQECFYGCQLTLSIYCW